MDRVMLHPPARPTCPAHPCSFHHPPALGQGRHLHILLGMALPLWPQVPPNLLYQTSPLSFLLPCSIRSLGNSYRVPTERLSWAKSCARHWGCGRGRRLRV